MRYHDYASRHIPLGSGVTEAACKTIFSQRLKLSGMRWTHVGARTMNLRVILLSQTWHGTFASYEWHCRGVTYFMWNVCEVHAAVGVLVFA